MIWQYQKGGLMKQLALLLAFPHQGSLDIAVINLLSS
jgi:hypothetical protein